MSEPLTLAAVGVVILTEGVKFLYGQAAEALKRWREHPETTLEAKNKTIPVKDAPPAIFVRELAPLEIHLDMLEPLQNHLLRLRSSLANYVDGLEPIDPNDQKLLAIVDALRQVMEVVYQQRLTFQGEQRLSTGPVVEGRIDVESIAGRVAAVEAALISSGRVSGTTRVQRVEETGTLYGVKTDKIGE
jgi:hypothetical protein